MRSRTQVGSTSATIQLSPARIRLVEILRAIYFGRIEHLVVRAAEPVLDPPPHIVRTLRFGAGQDNAPTHSLDEIAARPAVHHLMLLLDRLRDGMIVRLEVRDSTPIFGEDEIAVTDVGGSRD